MPTLEASSSDGTLRGAYVVAESAGDGLPDVILIGTGTEVSLAIEAMKLLEADGIAVRVVSMPSWELFDQQPQSYRDSVLPPEITARVSIEAGRTIGWEHYVGLRGKSIGLDHFGASAPYKELYTEFGITAEAMAAAARQVLGRG
ncbi:MAG: transketolase C-terminal domain-containing protein [Chloroflexota bacterium]